MGHRPVFTIPANGGYAYPQKRLDETFGARPGVNFRLFPVNLRCFDGELFLNLAGRPLRGTIRGSVTGSLPLGKWLLKRVPGVVQQITSVAGRGVPLFLDDIDTDRIIPARFLRCVTFDGLGEHAFEDDRKQDSAHPFDDARYQGGTVLISGRNFGCGSSREHAPQALARWGIRAIVAESFAEIFFGNCTSMGIPCLVAKRSDLEALAKAIAAAPQTEIVVDLEQQQVRAGNLSVSATMPNGPRSALVSGNWDFLGQLLDGAAAVKAKASTIPYVAGF